MSSSLIPATQILKNARPANRRRGDGSVNDFENGENVFVGVRIRPSFGSDSQDTSQEVIVEAGTHLVHQLDDNQNVINEWAFDYVFNKDSKNIEVFEIASHIVGDSLEGYNGTVFAYGKTASGKTHTIFGELDEPGVIILGLSQVFEEIEMNEEINFRISFAYIEIYNEVVIDLLNVNNSNLKIVEDPNYGPHVKGLTQEIIHSTEEALDFLKHGEKNRQYGKTAANDRSSRSHVIVQINITQTQQIQIDTNNFQNLPKQNLVKESRLYFVDLAGSERQKETNATGKRLEESKNINTSLMMLGRVISALSERGKKKERIPYRDSKLTHLLTASLGGNAKTAMIATISAETENLESTLSTLQYATRVKNIKNYAQINELMNLERDLETSWNEIVALRNQLETLRVKKEKRAQEHGYIQDSLEREFELSRTKVINCKSLLANVDQRAMAELGPIAQQLKQIQKEEVLLMSELQKEEKIAVQRAHQNLDEAHIKVRQLEKEILSIRDGATQKSKVMAEEIGNLQFQIRQAKENSRTIAQRRAESEKRLNLSILLRTPEVAELLKPENIEILLELNPDCNDIYLPLPLGLSLAVDDSAVSLTKQMLPKIQDIERQLVPSSLTHEQFWSNFFSHVFGIKKEILNQDQTTDENILNVQQYAEQYDDSDDSFV